ncbi:hypothetical protein L7F22_062842 [Adiantum nelumboides]|nr:hypothetical protein [Adiantum nelumboides]
MGATGWFPCRAIFIAEGGLVVPEATIVAAVEAYEKANTEVKGRGYHWNHFHLSSASLVVIYCKDGSVIEADHVIVVTVSSGFLKTVTSQISTLPINVCRCVDELRGFLPNKDTICQLFEPALPDWELESISHLGFGLIHKLFLQVDPSVKEQIRSYVVN